MGWANDLSTSSLSDERSVEHHHYYHEAPTVYREKRVYIEPRVYEQPLYKERLYPRRFAHAYQELETSPLLRASSLLGAQRPPALVMSSGYQPTHDEIA